MLVWSVTVEVAIPAAIRPKALLSAEATSCVVSTAQISVSPLTASVAWSPTRLRTLVLSKMTALVLVMPISAPADPVAFASALSPLSGVSADIVSEAAVMLT